MRLKVIAEGVTSMDEIRLLAELECDELQGYFFSEALPPQQLEDLLRRKDWLYKNTAGISAASRLVQEQSSHH